MPSRIGQKLSKGPGFTPGIDLNPARASNALSRSINLAGDLRGGRWSPTRATGHAAVGAACRRRQPSHAGEPGSGANSGRFLALSWIRRKRHRPCSETVFLARALQSERTVHLHPVTNRSRSASTKVPVAAEFHTILIETVRLRAAGGGFDAAVTVPVRGTGSRRWATRVTTPILQSVGGIHQCSTD